MDKEELAECIELGDKGLYLDIRVSSGSSRTKITGVNRWRDQLEVSIKERAEQGEANKAIINLFAELLNISNKKIKIVRGKTTKSKRLHFDGVDKTKLIGEIEKIYR